MRSSTWLLSLLLLCSSNSGASKDCSEKITVRSNQVKMAQLGQRLEVQCPVSFCSEPPPLVSWVKHRNGSDRLSSSESRWEGRSQGSGFYKGVSYLTFPSLFLHHSGEYRCETNFTKGHFINITVTGSAEVSVEDEKKENDRSAEVSVSEDEKKENDQRRAELSGLDQLWPYLWASGGVLLCVVVVVSLSVVSLQRCPGRPRTTVEYKNTVMPMTQHASALSNPGQAPPSDTPLGRRYGNRGEEEEEEEKEEDQSIW